MIQTPGADVKPQGFKEKLEDEAKKAFALSIYFGIWFCALAFLAATTLDERPIPLTIFGFALIKAALCAKFLLIGQASFPIKVEPSHGIVKSLFVESLIYLAIVVALNYLEAGLHGLIHGKNFIDSMTAFGQSNPLHVVAMSIIYWLIVWPYLVLMGIKMILGTQTTLTIFFGKKN
jgi:hypothetical protein